MELNEVTRKLPPHLLQFVVDQPYNAYTPVDQAVWRYVMRQNYNHLKKVAHETYVEGLRKTGVEIENIPTMYGMNRILKQIGWAAVAVDGFIPPGAFMEFTKYNVLVIAADIRTLEHIEYTPAPDIIHESAGHAPIIAEPEFAEYLRYIGEVGSKAFSSKKDYELYEAIRHLSIIKEDPNTKKEEIEKAEAEIEKIQANMGEPSEMALIRNLHWWTVEYGLIGSVDNYKLYGAGLLSSIGESTSCLSCNVKKIPYTMDAAYVNYDITKPQPQLFVTPDFKHLTTVLNQFKATMAIENGGLEGVKKAIASEHTGTLVLDNGLQISGTFVEVLKENDVPIFIKTSGPTALAVQDKEIDGFGKSRFANGFSTPLGKLKGTQVPLKDLRENELKAVGLAEGEQTQLTFEGDITVKGTVKQLFKYMGKLLFVILTDATVEHRGKELALEKEYTVAAGEKIVSAFAGAADVNAFQPNVNVPQEKTHKIEYDEKSLNLQELYGKVRKIRYEKSCNTDVLYEIWNFIQKNYPEDWLLPLEILELLEKNHAAPELAVQLKKYLEDKKQIPELSNLVRNGLALIYKEDFEVEMLE